MRLIPALAVAAGLAGCIGAGASSRSFRGEFAEISAEVDTLPDSMEKARLKELLTDLQAKVSAASAPARRDVDPGEIDNLLRMADLMEPAQLDLGFATGGKDWSHDGSDNGVEVHVIPRDSTGSAVKSPGSVTVTLSTEGGLGLGLGAKELDSWVVSPDTLRYAWNESLFPAYLLRLPWHDAVPDVSTALLTVTFRPLYGDSLTARKKIDIKARGQREPAGSSTAPATSETAPAG